MRGRQCIGCGWWHAVHIDGNAPTGHEQSGLQIGQRHSVLGLLAHDIEQVQPALATDQVLAIIRLADIAGKFNRLLQMGQPESRIFIFVELCRQALGQLPARGFHLLPDRLGPGLRCFGRTQRDKTIAWGIAHNQAGRGVTGHAGAQSAAHLPLQLQRQLRQGLRPHLARFEPGRLGLKAQSLQRRARLQRSLQGLFKFWWWGCHHRGTHQFGVLHRFAHQLADARQRRLLRSTLGLPVGFGQHQPRIGQVSIDLGCHTFFHPACDQAGQFFMQGHVVAQSLIFIRGSEPLAIGRHQLARQLLSRFAQPLISPPSRALAFS